MSKFKVGDKVRAVVSDVDYGLLDGSVHTVTSVHPMGNICLAETGSILWYPERFELVESKPKFEVGDKVRCVQNALHLTVGAEYTIVSVCPEGRWYRVVNDLNVVEGYSAIKFELVQKDAVLTPEEVFDHLRNGTKLQWRYKDADRWQDCINSGNVQVRCILDSEWRIKPEPEVIELNGKKYREIVE